MTIKKPQNATTIDTISEGYAAINRRPWLLLLPILLNVCLWFGPQISLGPLINNVVALVQQLQIDAPNQSVLQTEYQQQYEQMRGLGLVDMRQQLAVLNYIPLTIYVLGEVKSIPLMIYALSVVGANGTIGVPMVQGLPQLLDHHRTIIEIGNGWGMIVAFTIMNALLLPISAVFLTMVGEVVRGERVPTQTLLHRVTHAMIAILGYVGVVVGVMIMLGIPLLLVTALLVFVSPALGALMLTLLIMIWFWVSIYLGFAREAIVISGTGPIRAIHASFNIVRRNFWSTLGFLALSFLIAVGSGIIWKALIGSTIGIVAAIIGSAYIGSGLWAARMAFYRERLRRWRSAVQIVRI